MARKPLEENGIHRAKLWEIAFYAMNNTSTNAYMMLVAAISYFLVGIVGVGAVLAGSIVTIMRIWDGVTDPFVGMIVDNTNTKIGKNRPFIIVGQIILFVMTFCMFRFLPVIPTGGRFVAFILMYMVYIVGYTCQCVVTKSAQSCLTNDPEQRPIFSMFDAVYNILLMNLFWPVFLYSTMVPDYTLYGEDAAAMVEKNPILAAQLGEDGSLYGLYNPELWQSLQLIVGAIAAVLAILAIIGLWRKDNVKYFGTGKVQKISFRDYGDVLVHNRGIQMLVVAAGSDKLALSCTTATATTVALYAIIFGNGALTSSVSAITAIPIALIGIFGIGTIARKMGQKQCLVVGTYGALISAVILAIIIVVGAGGSFNLPTFSLTNPSSWGSLFVGSNWTLIAVLFMVVYVLMKGFSQLSGNIVIPMTADCADYEVYRTGRYVPGLMGTLFSFVDKLISSLAATIVAIVYAAVGYTDTLPAAGDPCTTGVIAATIICFLGVPAIGWLLNIVAMKFYPLNKEYMAEIQEEVARIKAEAKQDA